MLLNAMVYMPTIALNNTISYRVLEQQGLNFIQKFPRSASGARSASSSRCGSRISRADADDRAALHQRRRRGVPRAVRLHDAGLPAGARPARRASSRRWTGRVRAVPASADGRLLPLRDDARRGVADHERIRRRLPDDFTRDLSGSFGVDHPILLFSISQISETVFILTIPFFRCGLVSRSLC